jgi:glucose-1-phosphatase
MAALLFDIGNVLVTFDFQSCVRRLMERSSSSNEQTQAAISRHKDMFESGQMEEGEFVELVSKEIGFEGSASDFIEIWCDIFALNEPMAATLATLPREIPAYLLSNTNGPHLRFLLERFSIFKHFKGGVYSHEAKCMKPLPGIYEQAMASYNLDPATTFYVDDLIANIDTGRALGFTSHHYDPAQHVSLHRELNEWLRLA